MEGEKIPQLEFIRKALDELAASIQQGQYPASILEDFKQSLDNTRTLIWTIVKIEEEQGPGRGGYTFGLGPKLVEYRLRRAERLLRQIRLDIDASEIGIQTPGIVEFRNVVRDLQARLDLLLSTGR